jgi:hypothetical protein
LQLAVGVTVQALLSQAGEQAVMLRAVKAMLEEQQQQAHQKARGRSRQGLGLRPEHVFKFPRGCGRRLCSEAATCAA